MKHLESGAGGKIECVVKEGLARSKLKGVHKLCYMCGFEALKLYGESPYESETNCW